MTTVAIHAVGQQSKGVPFTNSHPLLCGRSSIRVMAGFAVSICFTSTGICIFFRHHNLDMPIRVLKNVVTMLMLSHINRCFRWKHPVVSVISFESFSLRVAVSGLPVGARGCSWWWFTISLRSRLSCTCRGGTSWGSRPGAVSCSFSLLIQNTQPCGNLPLSEVWGYPVPVPGSVVSKGHRTYPYCDFFRQWEARLHDSLLKFEEPGPVVGNNRSPWMNCHCPFRLCCFQHRLLAPNSVGVVPRHLWTHPEEQSPLLYAEYWGNRVSSGGSVSLVKTTGYFYFPHLNQAIWVLFIIHDNSTCLLCRLHCFIRHREPNFNRVFPEQHHINCFIVWRELRIGYEFFQIGRKVFTVSPREIF